MNQAVERVTKGDWISHITQNNCLEDFEKEIVQGRVT
jgi:hypothetical protein